VAFASIFLSVKDEKVAMFKKALPLKMACFCLGVLLSHAMSAIASGICLPPASGCASAGRDGNLTVVAASAVVNTYYPGISATGSAIMVGSPTGSPQGITSGDLLLVIQMQDGTPNAAGFYEYAQASSALPAGFGGTVTLASPLVNTYSTNVANNQTFQVVRVPQNDNLTIAGTGSIQSSPWNGSSGGIVALDVAEIFTLDGVVDVSTQGFLGATVTLTQGEGAQGPGVFSLTGLSNVNAGGASYAPNGGGGGGGANGGNGGRGGLTADTGNGPGYGGLLFSALCSQVVLGGGGGISSAGPALNARGTNGGGLILIRADTVAGSGSLLANGESIAIPDPIGGGGGGGAGGSIVIASNNALPAIAIQANGGNGTSTTSLGRAGGGGGGGGWIFISAGSAITSVSPGIAGSSIQSQDVVDGDPGQVGTSSLSCAPGICAGANCPLCAITFTAQTTPSCGCCHKGKIIITNVTGGSGGYLFSLNGGTPQSSHVFRHLSPGTYQVTVTDSSGCSATITVVVSRFR